MISPNGIGVGYGVISSSDCRCIQRQSLYRLNYAEQHLWSQLIAIPALDMLITPKQGKVFSYLVRDWQLG